jgi:SAM-dependent methyltransferase
MVERSDGFLRLGTPISRYLAPYEEWPASHRQAITWSHGRVLDLGCGAGKHALYLQDQEGLDVLGVDASPGAVEVCRRRGLRQAQVVSANHLGADLGLFSTVLLLGCNAGLFGSAAGVRRGLKTLDRLTTPDATIVAESSDPHPNLDPVTRAYRAANQIRGRMWGQSRLRLRYGQYATPWFDYLLVSRPELGELVEGSPWEIVETLDDPSIGCFTCRLQKRRR